MRRSSPIRFGKASPNIAPVPVAVRSGSLMAIVVIACLIGVSLYLAKRLSDVNAENTALQGQITSLKRQLARTRPGARR
jgi:hypothetical protein